MMNNLKTIQIVHLAFCLGVFLFASVAMLAFRDQAFFGFSLNSEPIGYIAPLFAVLGPIVGLRMFGSLMGDIAQQDLKADSKIARFQTAFIIKCAFLEGPAFFNIVAFILTHNFIFILFAAIPFIVLIYSRPSKDNVYSTLGIQESDFL